MLQYALVLLAGLLVKLSDEKKKLFLGISCGLLIAFLSAFDSLIASVFLPVLLANLAAGKIDSREHWTTFFVAMLSVFFLKTQLPVVSVLFFAAAYGDEFLKFKLPIARPLLPLGALAASLFLQDFSFFAVVVLFDLGYVAAERVANSAFGARITSF
ncbi:hypothetical protein HZC09_06620 [Candidatus Micrarchaeota archaeon]|nr:hypothetical protein [Candidatus Micrarchaeota archaeon]